MSQDWYKNGLRFSCRRCGTCCLDQGNYTEVYVTHDDIERLADHLGLVPSAFRKRYVTDSDGFEVLQSRGGACIMLCDNRCTAYPARPDQCRTWPFWPQNLTRHVWYGEVKKRCPGVGKGRLFTPEEIEHILLTKAPVS